MSLTATQNPPLVRYVPATFPMAIQAIAALEDRVREYQGYADRGADVAFVIVDCHAMIALIRETFGLWPRSEAELDAAHEQGVAELDALRLRDGIPDVPVALDTYWNRGA